MWHDDSPIVDIPVFHFNRSSPQAKALSLKYTFLLAFPWTNTTLMNWSIVTIFCLQDDVSKELNITAHACTHRKTDDCECEPNWIDLCHIYVNKWSSYAHSQSPPSHRHWQRHIFKVAALGHMIIIYCLLTCWWTNHICLICFNYSIKKTFIMYIA